MQHPTLRQLRSMWSELPSSYSDPHNLLCSSLRSTPAYRPHARGTRLAIPNCASRGSLMRKQCQGKSKPRPVFGDRAPCSQGFGGIGTRQGLYASLLQPCPINGFSKVFVLGLRIASHSHGTNEMRLQPEAPASHFHKAVEGRLRRFLYLKCQRRVHSQQGNSATVEV